MTKKEQAADDMTQRCLDEITMMSARIALADRDAVRIPYICLVSGRAKELMMISRDTAKRMVVATKGIIDTEEARILALLHISQLCEADIPKLLQMPFTKVQSTLAALADRGLASSLKYEEIVYYTQTPGAVHTQFKDLAMGAHSA